MVMLKVLTLQTLSTLSDDDQTGSRLKYRVSFMRLVGPALHEPVPDVKAIGLSCEQPTTQVRSHTGSARR